MAESLSGFFFDVERWFGSTATRRMSYEEKGVYFDMMCQEWRDKLKSLPDDPEAVADLIAVTEAQRAAVLAAWPVVRPKFVLDRRVSGRIINLKVEKTRRQQAANWRKRSEAGRVAGKASVAKRRHINDLDTNESLTTVERSSTDQKRVDKKRVEEKREIPRAREYGGEAAADPTHHQPLEQAVSRAHSGTVFDGSLPRDHRTHVFCDSTFTICVPSAVHAKFIGPYSRRCDGDREKAQTALKAWYAQIASELPSDFVMGDAFRFWQPRFDAAFATQVHPSASADAVLAELVRKGPSVRP